MTYIQKISLFSLIALMGATHTQTTSCMMAPIARTSMNCVTNCIRLNAVRAVPALIRTVKPTIALYRAQSMQSAIRNKRKQKQEHNRN